MNKIGSVVIIGAVLLLISLPAWAQKSGVINTVHDINKQGCVSCHAPHNGSVATGGTDQSAGTTLLWDRNFPAQTETFGTYDSPTLNSKTAEIGGARPLATDARMYSVLCMSCHDGVTTPGLTISPINAVGNPTAGTSLGLTNDHPINMAYDQTLDPGLQPVATVTTAGLKLYGTNNSVQCASCHDVHNNANTHFMRASNVNSGLCLTCHR